MCIVLYVCNNSTHSCREFRSFLTFSDHVSLFCNCLDILSSTSVEGTGKSSSNCFQALSLRIELECFLSREDSSRASIWYFLLVSLLPKTWFSHSAVAMQSLLSSSELLNYYLILIPSV